MWGNDLAGNFGTILNGAAILQHQSGKVWDAEAGMYYNAARWYDPRIGRFVSRSPLAPEGEEEYVFCGNDPVNWVDVNGENPFSDYIDKQFKNGEDIENQSGPGSVNQGFDQDEAYWKTGMFFYGYECGLVLATPGPDDLALMASLKGLVVATKANRIRKILNASDQISGVYWFTARSGKTYVGSSNDIMRRLLEHSAPDGRLLMENIKTIQFKEVKGGPLSRLIEEQKMINAMGGKENLDNDRNAMSVARQILYKIITIGD